MTSTLRSSLALRRLISSPLQTPIRSQRRHAKVLDVRFLQTHTEPRVIDKYRQRLEEKLKSEGLSSYDELKAAYKDKIEQVRLEAAAPPHEPARIVQPVPPPPTPILQQQRQQQQPEQKRSTPLASPIADAAKAYTDRSVPPGVKTLGSFVDVDKISAHEDLKEIEFIWRARFLEDRNSLCAVIPRDTYRRMEVTGRRHPMFILPLPREGQGVEIHFLQWTFPTPSSSTIMFTSLADYKLRGEYAVPHTTLTHHLELADSKNVVLAQGSVVENRGVSVDEARWLIMALQKFYGAVENDESGRRRKLMLEQFSTGDGSFKVDILIDEVQTIN
ncbi:hypothetical protein RUND412_004368 [Rhizina undulata]